MIKERPILFSSAMVRAILDGHKKQTRRVINPGKYLSCLDPEDDQEQLLKYCPYGQTGDRLWVRETWSDGPNPWGKPVVYRADVTPEMYATYEDCDIPRYWKSPIYMPRWASRITLEIVGVRVERLQSISQDDAIAEGVFMLAYKSHVDSFAATWDEINAKRGHSWESNPLVWAIE
ncbi:MAG TPA: hypothetical protein PKC18_12475, partial [Lacipirellulaceae bacterium]|nr:hypothetical protein [Lacipirellulaceae bacterium]